MAISALTTQPPTRLARLRGVAGYLMERALFLVGAPFAGHQFVAMADMQAKWGLLQYLEWISGCFIMSVTPIVIVVMIYNHLKNHWSFTNRHLWRFIPGGRLERGAARRVTTEWQRLSVFASEVNERLMQIQLDGGASIDIEHKFNRSSRVTLSGAGGQSKTISFLRRGAIMRAVERRQIEEVATLLDLPAGHTPRSMADVIAERMTPHKHSAANWGTHGIYNTHTMVYDVPEGITATVVRAEIDKDKNGEDGTPVMLLVEGPGIGLLRLPAENVNKMLAKARQAMLEDAFHVERLAAPASPTIIGNARASRLADVAGRALQEHPDLTDRGGARVDTLLGQHLPRLLQRHRDATRTAATSTITEIDAELDRGLDAIAASVGEALDRLAIGARDDLRTEVRFLEARRGGDTP